MTEKFLHERTLEEFGHREIQNTEIPSYLADNLNPVFELRPYQKEAFARFFLCFENNFPGEGEPLHFLFNIATGLSTQIIKLPQCYHLVTFHGKLRVICVISDSDNPLLTTDR